MAQLTAGEVFTPNNIPRYTYVERISLGLDVRLRDCLSTRGAIVSISGPSKSGKSVLVRTVVQDKLIAVSGSEIQSDDGLCKSILAAIDAPSSVTVAHSRQAGGSTEAIGEASASVGLLGGKAQAKFGGSRSSSSSHTASFAPQGPAEVVRRLRDSGKVVLVDDFHYIPSNLHGVVARQVKAIAEQGVPFCLVCIPHRTEDVVRSNGELRGRLSAIDFDYWDRSSLEEISSKGFRALNAYPSPELRKLLCDEALGSPQLMQFLCLQICFGLGLREVASQPRNLSPANQLAEKVLSDAARSIDHRVLAEAIVQGPSERGSSRKDYEYKQGGFGDIYSCIVSAFFQDPPLRSIPLNEIMSRLEELLIAPLPPRANVLDTCRRMARIAQKLSPLDYAIDWHEESQRLEILDPYFLFYLRRVSLERIRIAKRR